MGSDPHGSGSAAGGPDEFPADDMKLLLKMAILLGVLGAGAYFAYAPVMAYWKSRNRVYFRTAEVERGDIISVVNSSGTIQPVLRVDVGSFVSGPIKDLFADFNQEVAEGKILAKIDPRLYEPAVARETASLKTRKAEVARVEALLEQATKEEKRALELRARHKDFISDTELDQIVANRKSLKAQLEVAEAAVDQAQAGLENAELNLEYTDIRSPVAGRVIDRKIDRGQTLAAQFQTPQLFVVAPNMEEEMHVFASVDEADIGLIRRAQQRDALVEFTVDAYPDDLFTGTIAEIRFNPTTVQNVVTYPVVVTAPNPELKLLPGMTANISFQIEKRSDVLKVPNAALRFYPERDQVREQDRKLLEGGGDDETNDAIDSRSAAEDADAKRRRNRRHVWIAEGELLRAVEIETGISDSQFSELVAGELKEGQKLVTGVSPTPL